MWHMMQHIQSVLCSLQSGCNFVSVMVVYSKNLITETAAASIVLPIVLKKRQKRRRKGLAGYETGLEGEIHLKPSIH